MIVRLSLVRKKPALLRMWLEDLLVKSEEATTVETGTRCVPENDR